MVYKIVWNSGGETAERYSSRRLANAVLKNSRFQGRVVKTRLRSPGRSAPSRELRFGGRMKEFPQGRKLRWKKFPAQSGGVTGFVYRTRVD